MNLGRGRTALLTLASLGMLAIGPARAQERFRTYFVAVGNSNYVTPAASALHGFPSLSGANSSARTVARILHDNGAVAGVALTSAPNRYVSKADFERALDDMTRIAHSERSTKPFLVVYFAGHGISEGVAWNHFSLPGDFAYGKPLQHLDIEALGRSTIHAAALVDRLDRTGIPYLLLLDNCYEGREASFGSPVLTAGAVSSLESVSGILRYVNEFHGPNPVIFSAVPGRTVPLAPDPRSPEQASLGPLGRRLYLLASRLAASGKALRLSEVVAQLTSKALDRATTPPVTHAKAPTDDAILLGSAVGAASVENRTGTATSESSCCEAPDSGARRPETVRLRGGLTFQGPPGEYVSGGKRIALPPLTPVTLKRPDPRSLELNFAVDDAWELDLSVAEGSELVPGTYRGATRYPFQSAARHGLSLSGAGRGCNEIAGAFTIEKLRLDPNGQVLELVATFAQRCDDGDAGLSGSLAVVAP
jgi:hypothetical protein